MERVGANAENFLRKMKFPIVLHLFTSYSHFYGKFFSESEKKIIFSQNFRALSLTIPKNSSRFGVLVPK